MQLFTKDQIPHIAKQIIEKISGAISARPNTAIVVALSGDLGAGKTSLVQEVAKQLGITETVISPTFTIMKSYKLQADDFKLLVHIDAYRLKSGNELLKLGWNDIVADPKNIVFMEWPEQVPELTANHTFKITLSHKDDETRIFAIL